jgi:hypothetical protein
VDVANIYTNSNQEDVMTKNIRSFCAGIALLVMAGSSSAGSPWALYGSFASMGSTVSPVGGLRYSLNSDICFDLGAGANLGYKDTNSNNVSLYADAFFVGQTMGVFVSIVKVGVGDVEPTVGVAYTLERAINDKITIGCSPVIASYKAVDGNGIDILPGVNVYTVIGF